MKFLKKLKTGRPYDPPVPFLGICSRNPSTYQEMLEHILETIFMIAKWSESALVVTNRSTALFCHKEQHCVIYRKISLETIMLSKIREIFTCFLSYAKYNFKKKKKTQK